MNCEVIRFLIFVILLFLSRVIPYLSALRRVRIATVLVNRGDDAQIPRGRRDVGIDRAGVGGRPAVRRPKFRGKSRNVFSRPSPASRGPGEAFLLFSANSARRHVPRAGSAMSFRRKLCFRRRRAVRRRRSHSSHAGDPNI